MTSYVFARRGLLSVRSNHFPSSYNWDMYTASLSFEATSIENTVTL